MPQNANIVISQPYLLNKQLISIPHGNYKVTIAFVHYIHGNMTTAFN